MTKPNKKYNRNNFLNFHKGFIARVNFVGKCKRHGWSLITNSGTDKGFSDEACHT